MTHKLFQFFYLSIYLFIYLSVYLFIYRCFCVFFWLSVFKSAEIIDWINPGAGLKIANLARHRGWQRKRQKKAFAKQKR